MPWAAPFAPLGPPLCTVLCVSDGQTGSVSLLGAPFPRPPFFPGSWNALLTLPFPEGLRPCSLRGNWVWHTWAGAITQWDSPTPHPQLGTGMLGEWGGGPKPEGLEPRVRWMGDQRTFLII